MSFYMTIGQFGPEGKEMNWDSDLNYASDDSVEADLQMEMIELRHAVASTLGRHQYAYDLLDKALETGHLESMKRARQEFDNLGDDVRIRILDAAGATS